MKPGTPYRYIEHPFDAQFGTDTGGYIGARELAIAHAHDALNNGYSAIAPSVFHEAIRRWRKTLGDPRGRIEDYSFFDIGAGKGRPLLLAGEYTFRSIVGIEINPDLAKIAQWNIQKWRRERRTTAPMRIVCTDATVFRWPNAPLLAYLYNPFERELVRRLIQRLARRAQPARTKPPHTRSHKFAAARPLDVMYVNPVHADLFVEDAAAREAWKHLWSARLTMNQADQDADPYATTTDVVSVYRLRDAARTSARE